MSKKIEKKLIITEDRLYEYDPAWWTEHTIQEMIDSLKDTKRRIQEQYPDVDIASVKYNHFADDSEYVGPECYGNHYVYFFTGDREETDKEFAERIRLKNVLKESKRLEKEKRNAEDLALYNKLKKKFES